MTDVKRNHTDIAGSAAPSDPKKPHSKPGRKPIDSEPKSKRIAQNRAAQRAYRERKEKKMQDLEGKVKFLEDQNVRVNTESDFLRAQVDILKNELARYRGTSDFSYLNVQLPTKVGKLSKPETKGFVPNFDGDRRFDKNSSASDFDDSRSNSNASGNDSSPDTELSTSSIKLGLPWGKDNLQLNPEDPTGGQLSNVQVPDLVSGSSSSTSPLNDNILVSPPDSKFDEALDPFCNSLNEACGTRSAPVPKYKADLGVQTFSNYYKDSPFSGLFMSPNSNSNIASNEVQGDLLNDQFFNSSDSALNLNLATPNQDNDPLSFLNDNNFDVGVAFNSNNTDSDPIRNLVSEESVYDPLQEVNTDFNFNDFIKSSFSSEASIKRDAAKKPAQNDDEEVVPAPEKTFRCSEVWDRITSHPRYTEIDIDGLCNELKSKAKCSERGVVINASDVTNLIEKSATKPKTRV